MPNAKTLNSQRQKTYIICLALGQRQNQPPNAKINHPTPKSPTQRQGAPTPVFGIGDPLGVYVHVHAYAYVYVY